MVEGSWAWIDIQNGACGIERGRLFKEGFDRELTLKGKANKMKEHRELQR